MVSIYQNFSLIWTTAKDWDFILDPVDQQGFQEMKTHQEVGLIAYGLVSCPRVYSGEFEGEKKLGDVKTVLVEWLEKKS